MNTQQATEEIRELERNNQQYSDRYRQLQSHVRLLQSKPFDLNAALRHIRQAGAISQAAFVRFARTKGLTRDGARDLFKQAALAS
jgi:hypothetical protein